MSTATATGAEPATWDLRDLYVGVADERLEADLAAVAARAREFRSRYSGSVASLAPADLAHAVDQLEEIEALSIRTRAYAYLLFSENTDDAAAKALYARTQELEAELETQLVFFRLEWTAIDEERARAALEDETLARRRNYLCALRRYRPHLLSEPEEQILAETTPARRGAWRRLYDELLSDVRVELAGAEATLEEGLARLHDGSRDVRRDAAAGITAGLAPGLGTRGFVLNAMLLDRATENRLRRYPHWLAARNLENRTPDAAVEALVGAVTRRYDIAHRYYALKARLLGLQRLAHYDRSAPLAEHDGEIPWEDAVALVRRAYEGFAPDAGRIAAEFFDRRWIDAPARPGKAFGAFCWTRIPGVHPYVLMSYTRDRRSVLTLAHELGHGLHGVLAGAQGAFDAKVPLTVSETASVFGEALTFRLLHEQAPDDQTRLDLLLQRLDDAVGTVFRQIALNRFEDAMHSGRRERGELAVSRLTELWLETQAQMLGDAVELDGYETWWSYIPHFVEEPGYVYAYAYGYLLSLAIYRRYEVEGDAIVEPYLALLRAGGSAPPAELAALVGIDVADPRFWEEGLAVIEGTLDEAEAAAAALNASAAQS